MNRLTTTALVLSVAISGAALAEIIEIPLPGLHGLYPDEGAERGALLEIVPPPVSIDAVWFRLSCTATVGAVECDGGGGGPWPLEFGATMTDETTGGWWSAWELMPEEPGPFSWTARFRPSQSTPPTWAFLLDGQAEVQLFGAPMILVGLCWPVNSPPEGVVEEAFLILSGTFAIPIESGTWGRVKALYSEWMR
jgi:hypothetical protein